MWLLAVALAASPSPAATPPEATPPEAPPPALTPSERAALRNSLVIHVDPATPGGWWVETGARSGPVSTLTFAGLIEDPELQARLERARATTNTARIGAGVLGVTGVVGGFMLVGSAGPEVRVPREPDPRRFEDWSDYEDQRTRWELRQAGADARDEAITDGAVMLALGALCWVSVPLIGGDVRLELRHPGLAMPLDRARSAVDAYNARIRARFGVSATGVTVTVETR